ncbi:YhcN/YlaJ family sporulation lipoprotein [Virgibacillus ainsalahensis]
MKSKMTLFLFSLLVITGCANTDETQNNNEDVDTQPMHYETEDEKKERMGTRDRTTGEQEGNPNDIDKANSADFEGGYSDPYTTEETEAISRKLKEHEDIIQAQVASTDERIMIGLRLKEHTDPNIPNNIQEEVKEIIPNTDKQIIVFSDEIYWDRMKNLKTRGDSGNDMNKLMDDFLKIED